MKEEKETVIALSMGERFEIMGTCLPKEGDIAYIRTMKTTKDMLTPTEEEEDEYAFSVKEIEGKPMLTWRNDKKDEVREFTFSPRMMKMVKKLLYGHNKNKALTENHITLWEKFACEEDEDG